MVARTRRRVARRLGGGRRVCPFGATRFAAPATGPCELAVRRRAPPNKQQQRKRGRADQRQSRQRRQVSDDRRAAAPPWSSSAARFLGENPAGGAGASARDGGGNGCRPRSLSGHRAARASLPGLAALPGAARRRRRGGARHGIGRARPALSRPPRRNAAYGRSRGKLRCVSDAYAFKGFGPRGADEVCANLRCL